MQNDFYYRFEQHFRGSRDEIKRRQSVYLPILEPLKTIQSPSLTLDLGCGRGEWLELMSGNGFSAQGVDIDEAMLQFCAEQGLTVRKADALDCLRSVPDATMSVVSGFHIAEHLPFETLRSLIVEALRVLIPGGILIFETPNPENLEVGSCNFYTDPTHRAPLPPRLLAYLGEDAGFKRLKVLRLNQPPQEWYSNSAEFPSLSRVIFGVGPDYAIVAQKEAAPETLTAFSWFAEPEDGSNSLGRRINEFDAELLAIQQQTQRVQNEQMARLEELSSYQRGTEEEIARLTALWEGAQRVQSEQMARLDAVMNSRSWRITAPLRNANAILRNAKPQIKARLKPLLTISASFVSKRPRLKHFLLILLNPFPDVKARLQRAAGLSPSTTIITFKQDVAATGLKNDISPRAQKIYTILKQNAKHEGFQ
ncbi:methyltransferase domain-containing protein [Acidithiobacillus caldus]